MGPDLIHPRTLKEETDSTVTSYISLFRLYAIVGSSPNPGESRQLYPFLRKVADISPAIDQLA